MELTSSKELSYLDEDYKGDLKISAMLLKHKWNAGIGLLFSRFVTRCFVLDIEKFTFGYYKDSSCTSGSYIFSVADITSVSPIPLIDKCPSESSIGFTIYTTSRPFHLFAYANKVKSKFMYAFAAINIIPSRPDFYQWESVYLQQCRPDLLQQVGSQIKEIRKPPASIEPKPKEVKCTTTVKHEEPEPEKPKENVKLVTSVTETKTGYELTSVATFPEVVENIKAKEVKKETLKTPGKLLLGRRIIVSPEGASAIKDEEIEGVVLKSQKPTIIYNPHKKPTQGSFLLDSKPTPSAGSPIRKIRKKTSAAKEISYNNTAIKIPLHEDPLLTAEAGDLERIVLSTLSEPGKPQRNEESVAPNNTNKEDVFEEVW